MSLLKIQIKFTKTNPFFVGKLDILQKNLKIK